MAKDWVDFREVKAAVSMEMALAHYSVTLRRVNKTSLRGACPLPIHPEGTNPNSFGVSTEKNAWSCQVPGCVASRIGRKGGNVLDFVAVMEDCSIRDAALKLQNWFSVGSDTLAKDDGGESVPSDELVARREGEADSETESVNAPLDFELHGVDHTHPYLPARGILEETAQVFGVGYFPGKGSMAGRVVIPIHNESGELVAYAGRALDEEKPKYKLPAGFRKSLVLYNLHRALEAREGGVAIVVEGFFDAMQVHQAGFPRVVSLMGATLSGHQERLLVGHFDRVVLMLDGDGTGREAASVISSQLIDQVFVQIVRVPDGTQPDELSSDAIRELLAFV